MAATKTYESVLAELDAAARVNLPASRLAAYDRYKADLIASCESPDDIDAILRGFIWAEIEEGDHDG